MINIILEYIAHDVNGESGFMLQGSNSEILNACNESRLMTHDILEHVNTAQDLGTREDELQALGAILFGRYNYENLNLKIDLDTELENFANGHDLEELEEQEKTDFDEDILYLLDQLEDEYIKEELEENERTLEQFKNLALQYMRLGVAKAELKFGDSLSLSNLFFNLQTELNPIIKNAQEYSTITIDIDSNHNIKIQEQEFDYND